MQQPNCPAPKPFIPPPPPSQKRTLFAWESLATNSMFLVAIGAVFGLSIGLMFGAPKFILLWIFLVIMCIFHYWEWLYVALFRPSEISPDCIP